MDRHGAGRIVRRVARRAALDKPIGPHALGHAFTTAQLWTPACRSATSKKRRPPNDDALRPHGSRSIATPPISSPRS
jgi:hypothetical protein